MGKKLIKSIGLVLVFLFIIIMKGTTLRTTVFYFFLLLVIYLWYHYNQQMDNEGKWYINKPILFICLFILIIPIAAYYFGATNGLNYKIILLAILIAIFASVLISLYKGKGR